MGRSSIPSKLVPAKQIEENWQITPKMLRRAAAEGIITSYKFGHRTLRYDPEEVMAKLCTTNRDWERA